jgi:hypothetical protein
VVGEAAVEVVAGEEHDSTNRSVSSWYMYFVEVVADGFAVYWGCL